MIYVVETLNITFIVVYFKFIWRTRRTLAWWAHLSHGCVWNVCWLPLLVRHIRSWAIYGFRWVLFQHSRNYYFWETTNLLHMERCDDRLRWMETFSEGCHDYNTRKKYQDSSNLVHSRYLIWHGKREQWNWNKRGLVSSFPCSCWLLGWLGLKATEQLRWFELRMQ